jgi:hypothetical protein
LPRVIVEALDAHLAQGTTLVDFFAGGAADPSAARIGRGLRLAVQAIEDRLIQARRRAR